MTEYYTPVLPTEPFDLGTLPSKFLPSTKGCAGKVLKVSSDEKTTYWGSGGGGTDDYEDLINKPQISSVELFGNITLEQIGAVEYSTRSTAHPTLKIGIDADGNISMEY